MPNGRRSVRERADRGQASREKWLAQRDEINAQVRENIPTLDAILPSHMNAAQFTAIVSGLLARDDDLALAAIRNPTSFLAALADCARLGLVPGDGYALIALGVSENSSPTARAEVLGLTEYTGEIELIYRTGLVESVIAEVVHQHDHYVPGRKAHEIPEFSRGPTPFATDAERGPAIGAFCYCLLKDGGNTEIVAMNRDRIMSHREVARTKKIWDGPFWVSMWLKTVVHEQYKWVSKSAEFRQQTNTASAALGGSALGALTPVPTIETVEVPALKVRAIGVGNGDNGTQPERRQGRGFSEIMRLFEQIGVTDETEQLAVVQAIATDYERGARITEQQAEPIIAQLRSFIDDADDAGEPGSDDEFEGRTAYDVLRDWLNSPADKADDRHRPEESDQQ